MSTTSPAPAPQLSKLSTTVSTVDIYDVSGADVVKHRGRPFKPTTLMIKTVALTQSEDGTDVFRTAQAKLSGPIILKGGSVGSRMIGMSVRVDDMVEFPAWAQEFVVSLPRVGQ